MGDGGAADDPHGNGQNPKALLGKILRFDVDAANAEARDRRTSACATRGGSAFDAKTGDLYIGDVGQNLWEEVDVVAGRRRRAAQLRLERRRGQPLLRREPARRRRAIAPGFTPPVVEYPHDEGCSITGGVMYRGKALPRARRPLLLRRLLHGPAAQLRCGRNGVRSATEHWDWKAAIDREAVLTQISSFGVDADGELYIVELTGSIYQLVPKS